MPLRVGSKTSASQSNSLLAAGLERGLLSKLAGVRETAQFANQDALRKPQNS